MKYPETISGHPIYPLTADGFDVGCDGFIWVYDQEGHKALVQPWFDQRWKVRVANQDVDLIQMYRYRSNAFRAWAVQKQHQVNDLISEIIKLTRQADDAARDEARSSDIAAN